MERTAEDTICMRSEEAPRKEFIPVRRRPQGRDVSYKSSTTVGRKKDDFEWLTSHINTMDLYCSIRRRNLPAKSKVCHYKCLCITLGMQSSTPWADVSQSEPLQNVCVNDPLLVHQKSTALAKSTTWISSALGAFERGQFCTVWHQHQQHIVQSHCSVCHLALWEWGHTAAVSLYTCPELLGVGWQQGRESELK